MAWQRYNKNLRKSPLLVEYFCFGQIRLYSVLCYTRAKLTLGVLVINERKMAPVNLQPCRLHVSDGFQHVLMHLTSHLCDVERRHALLSFLLCLQHEKLPLSAKSALEKVSF